MKLRIDATYLRPFIEEADVEQLWPRVVAAHEALVEKRGMGSHMLGWREMLLQPNDALLEDILLLARQIREEADVFLVLGIGGSYLGAKATIEAFTPWFERTGPEILFAGHHLSGAYLKRLLAYLEGKSVFVNVISKSGTTLETAVAFRVVRQWMHERFSDAARRIVVTTDPKKGVLNRLRETYGYRKYEIPPDVGGRFSVLTPVGLLPIAVAGVDIRSLFYGAVEAARACSLAEDNPALSYAAYRYLLHEARYMIEVLAVFEPKLFGFGQWWQQLFGESEGKEHKGLYPDVLQYSTDLHSMGQYMQQGRRIVIETFLMVEHLPEDLVVPGGPDHLDGLDYVEGKTFQEIAQEAYRGTAKAHHDGGVPNMTIWLEALTPEVWGETIYFFEHAVAVSGYLLGVNPFDQPGVEAYKREMYRLLGRV